MFRFIKKVCPLIRYKSELHVCVSPVRSFTCTTRTYNNDRNYGKSTFVFARATLVVRERNVIKSLFYCTMCSCTEMPYFI